VSALEFRIGLALDPLEIGVILVIGVGIFYWGPEKLPEMMKQVNSYRKQLDGYTKQLQGITKEIETSMTTGNIDNLANVLSNGPLGGKPADGGAVAGTMTVPGGASPSIPGAVKSGDALLLEMARKLGIATQGKTRDEIQNEIVTRASQAAEMAPAPKDLPAEPTKEASEVKPTEPAAEPEAPTAAPATP
jgi:Sec-independent protein translocase protein TatA